MPYEDSDEKVKMIEADGESLYSDPPSSNSAYIDHGMDENNVWNFALSASNQPVTHNEFKDQFYDILSKRNPAPQWGQKLQSQFYFTEEKQQKFIVQWNMRLGLNKIKQRHSLIEAPTKEI
jgi:hypothetical protein